MSRSSTATPRSRPSRGSWRDAAFGPWGSSSMSPTMRPCSQAADGIHAALGRTDHVVHAVAVGSGKYGFPFWNLEPADWPRVLQVNIVGAVNVAHAFAPALVAARSGTLLFLASVAGQIGSQTDPPYSASKAALINFAQCAAKDLAPFGVRVNALCPGMVKTDLNRAVWEAWARRRPEAERRSYEEWADDKLRRTMPLGRWQTAGGRGGDGGVPGVGPRRQRDRTDGQRRRRIRHALVDGNGRGRR